MQVFVSEYLTCGACPGDLADTSLAAEGRSMVQAVIADIARVTGCRVATTWDSRLDLPRVEGLVEWVLVRSTDEERGHFRELAARCDATFVIAPEFHGILLDRQRLVVEAGGRWLGCSAEAIALCADKLRLATHLHACGIRTIETWPLPGLSTADPEMGAEYAVPSTEYPLRNTLDRSGPTALVVKPRDGAGSQMTFRVSTPAEFERVCREFAVSEFRDAAIVQPYLPGRAVSAAAIVSLDGGVEVFPFAEQHLSGDGRFRYLGGRVGYPPPDPEQTAIATLVRQTCRVLPGLAGYVGFDMILPDDAPTAPVLVEINPRLTTSYLGYRDLTRGNLADYLILPERRLPVPAWRSVEIVFRPDNLA